MTGTRVHAVTAEQERPLGSGGVRGTTRHAVLTGREANQLLTKGDRDPLALGSLTQHQVQAGAQDIDAWGSDFRPGSITHLPKLFAFPIPDHQTRNGRSLLGNETIKPEWLEHVEPIACRCLAAASIIRRLLSRL